MNRVVVAGNWKMNKTRDEAINFIKGLKGTDLSSINAEVHVYAPSIYLSELHSLVEGTNIVIGCENIHQEASGAYTGEISAPMLASIGIANTLVGHSERRQYFNETDEIVNAKTKMALENGISPIVCVGETLDERNANITNEVLKTQTEAGLKGLSAEDMKNVLIAYEPVWAIGTGKTATAEDANKACAYVREIISGMFGEDVAKNVVIQYGGSVNPGNAKEILGQSDINGALVGGASLELDSFLQLMQ